jgi:hypothetical protein
MTSQNLKEMNLPSNHQKDTQSSVYVADTVFSVSDVKAAALSQAATLRQETKGEIVSAMGELKYVMKGGEKVKGRDKNQQVSQPVTTTIMVMYCVVEKYEAVKYAVVVDMLDTPLSLTRESVREDSASYDDDKWEEVLAEQEMMLEGLSSYQEQKNYEVAEWRSVDERHNVEVGIEMKEKTVVKPKEVKLGRRCEKSCKM